MNTHPLTGNRYPKDYFDTDTVVTLLLLADVDASAETIASWTPEERHSAGDWALRSHLRASDNLNRVPARPPHIDSLSAANQTVAGADGQSKPIASSAPASRDVIVQLVIDTGGRTLCPVSDDYRLTPGMVWTCSVFLLPLELLKDKPASEAATLIRSGLELSHVYDAPQTKDFLRKLLADCDDNPRAVVSVMVTA
jgi:hypothetical protein